MRRQTISDDDHGLIAGEIEKAEARTSGEIFCVVAHASGNYFHAAAFYVFIALLAASLIAALALEAGWYSVRLPVFVAAQIAAAAVLLLALALWPRLQMLLAPRRLQFRLAHENAVRQFLARNIHMTAERTGVLLFVSLAERYAEVVADSGIDEKVSQEEWNAIVGELIAHARKGRPAEGFVVAIRHAGDLLAAHFPPGTENPNELDDHLVEI